MAGWKGKDLAEMEGFLGPESRRWWRDLEEFSSGRSPGVMPVDDGEGLQAAALEVVGVLGVGQGLAVLATRVRARRRASRSGVLHAAAAGYAHLPKS
jgi:hypothetical protein